MTREEYLAKKAEIRLLFEEAKARSKQLRLDYIESFPRLPEGTLIEFRMHDDKEGVTRRGWVKNYGLNEDFYVCPNVALQKKDGTRGKQNVQSRRVIADSVKAVEE